MALVCIARDLFGIYFPVFVVYRRPSSDVAGYVGTPIRVRGEPEFGAVQAGLCRQGWGTQPRGGSGFCLRRQAEFQRAAVFILQGWERHLGHGLVAQTFPPAARRRVDPGGLRC